MLLPGSGLVSLASAFLFPESPCLLIPPVLPTWLLANLHFIEAVYKSIIPQHLLVVMAFDRHATVCKPLHYTTTMTDSVCAHMVIGCYAWGLFESAIHTGFIFSLSCHSNVVHHFFCDIPPILSLSCFDKYVNEIVLFILASFNVFFALIVIFTSYVFIFIAILRMHSAEGQKKAFSTCASHLTAMTIFYGTVIFMYLQSSSSHSMDNDQMASVFCTIVVPMLNPVVHSLRNKEVHNALKKVVEKIKTLLSS